MNLIITHLSDIHIRYEKDLRILLERTKSIAGAITETIRSVKDTVLLICVTGDIAYSGKEEQYDWAKVFFDDLYYKLVKRNEGLEIQFAFVPGNHDCDFEHKGNMVRKSIIKSNELNMNDASTMELCTVIQKGYFDFVKYYVDKTLTSPNRQNSIFTQNELLSEQLDNYKIKLHCLNTSWCSLLDEKKDMPFCVPEGIGENEELDVVITLMHHGENWFNWKGNENWNNYHRKYSDIVLVGHDHYSDFVQKKNYDDASNYYIKGNQLYSTDLPEKSGFNIFKINLKDKVEFFYSYEWNGEVYERIIDSKAQVFEKNRFRKSKMGLEKTLSEYLEDIEIDILNKYKSPLLLSDVYVFPSLRGKAEVDFNKAYTYREQEGILKVIQQKKKVIVTGNKEYGKTALVKRLFMIFYGMGLFPIFYDFSKINSPDEDVINEHIREIYAKSYVNVNIDEIMQMEKEKKLCIIDNFDGVLISDKSQKKFLENISSMFDIIILTANKQNVMIDTVKRMEINEYISQNYFELEICKLRSYGKNRIIDKWLLLEDNEQDVNSLEFDVKRKAKLAEMQSVLKNGYFSNTPLEFLLVLSYIDNTEAISTDYSRFSYIYDCLIRDKINEISDNDTKVALAYKTLLELLAYNLYLNEESSLFDEKYILEAVSDYNENYPPLKGTTTSIVQKLVQFKILEEKNDKFKFRYNYMYYYFAGGYIVEHLSPEEKETTMDNIFLNLSLQSNYNIALFIAYSMNAQYQILPKIKSISSELLSGFENFKYEDQKEFLDKINADVLDRLNDIYEIPENKQIPDKQKALQMEVDEREENKEYEIDNSKSQQELDSEYSDCIKLLRLIEFQGDIIKNYATKIPNKPRGEIIELMAESNMKLIGYMCNMISDTTDKIIEIVENKLKENGEVKRLEKDMLLDWIKDFISILWSSFIRENISSFTNCIESELLEKDIIVYKENEESEFWDMVNIEYKIRTSNGKLPVSDIEKTMSGKTKLSSFSSGIMKHIVAYYLSMYQYEAKDKKQVCSLLGFAYNKLYVREQKLKVLELED